MLRIEKRGFLFILQHFFTNLNAVLSAWHVFFVGVTMMSDKVEIKKGSK